MILQVWLTSESHSPLVGFGVLETRVPSEDHRRNHGQSADLGRRDSTHHP